MICKTMGVVPRFVYSGNVAPGVSQRWFADISRLKSLGYRPRVSFTDGLDETVAWFREVMRVEPSETSQTSSDVVPVFSTKI